MARFDTEISKDLAWREIEIDILRQELRRETGDYTRFNVKYRAFICILYAHVEGFTKFTIQSAYDHIVESGASVYDLQEAIAAKTICASVRVQLNALSNQELASIIAGRRPLVSDIRLSANSEFARTSNLWFDVLEELLDNLYVEVTPFNTYRTDLNHLVSIRNECAHGDHVLISRRKPLKDAYNDVSQLERRCRVFMHELALRLIEYVERREYVLGCESL